MTEEKEWVNWQNARIVQKVAIVDEENNILILKRVKTGPAHRPGKEDLPGGNMGPEDLIDGTKPHIEAIKREAKEETGLDITGLEIAFVDSWVSIKSIGRILNLAIGYKAVVKGIKPVVTLSDEHTDFKWVTREEALNADFGDDRGLHKSILQRI